MELWRPVVGFEGKYLVSDRGRIQSLTCSRGIRKVARLKKARIDKDGYLHVGLCTGKAATQKMFRVSRLVLTAFIGGPPTPKHEAAHGDGDCQNNRLWNLRWATKSENEIDKIEHGHHGEAIYNAILTADQARMIKLRISQGAKRADVLAEVGCSLAVYKNIKRGVAWKRA